MNYTHFSNTKSVKEPQNSDISTRTLQKPQKSCSEVLQPGRSVKRKSEADWS